MSARLPSPASQTRARIGVKYSVVRRSKNCFRTILRSSSSVIIVLTATSLRPTTPCLEGGCQLGSVRARASQYRLTWDEANPGSCGLQDGQNGHAAAEELVSAAIGGNTLMVAGARAEEAAQFIVCATEPRGGSGAFEAPHWSVAPLDTAVVLLQPIIQDCLARALTEPTKLLIFHFFLAPR